MMSDSFKTSKDLNVISSRFPIGVETIYKPGFKNSFKMIKIFITFLSYILIFFNTNVLSDENKINLRLVYWLLFQVIINI